MFHPAPPDELAAVIAAIPAGRWAIGVSGGADSVALLHLIRSSADLDVHAVHLDHQTRAGASAVDARFVTDLCAQLGVPLTATTRSAVEASLDSATLPAGDSARFRRLRQALFQRVCNEQQLQGVLLAHHADDQAETVLQRLLRGSSPAGLGGMKVGSCVAGLRIVRPLLGIRAARLREYLNSIRQRWREDATNRSPAYQRSRLRHALMGREKLADALLHMAGAMRALSEEISAAAPVLPETFRIQQLADLPDVLAAESARRWLLARGVPPGEMLPAIIKRLVTTSRDAASPARQHFPGKVLVCRRKGEMSVQVQ